MLDHDRIDVFGRIDVNKTNKSKKCDICLYWYFQDKGFKFQQDICNECHDVFMIYINLSNIVVLNIHSAIYCCTYSKITKSEVRNLM